MRRLQSNELWELLSFGGLMTVRDCCFAKINELLRAENAMIREDGQGTDETNHGLG